MTPGQALREALSSMPDGDICELAEAIENGYSFKGLTDSLQAELEKVAAALSHSPTPTPTPMDAPDKAGWWWYRLESGHTWNYFIASAEELETVRVHGVFGSDDVRTTKVKWLPAAPPNFQL